MGLGTSDGFDKPKSLFIAYVVMIFVIMLIASVGATQEVRMQIYFYLIFAGILFGLPYIVDMFSSDSDYIDTVTWEEPPSVLQSYPVQIIAGALLAGITFWRGVTTKKAWINAPKFNVFKTPVGEGLLSGLAIAENWFAFGFVFPTLYTNIENKLGDDPISQFLSFMIAAIATSTLFMLGHKLIVYRNDEVALLSTWLFGFANCIFTAIFRSMVVSDMLHFSNNFIVGAGIAQKIGLGVAKLW